MPVRDLCQWKSSEVLPRGAEIRLPGPYRVRGHCTAGPARTMMAEGLIETGTRREERAVGESFEFKGPVNESGERTIVRDMCFIGVAWGGNACSVDVKDGKVLRIRPARFYDQYTREEVKPWVMHARGKTFDPGDKTLPPPFSIAYKKRVFSPARVRFPMKRVDFDPAGAPGSTGPGGRNIQNRGVSKYVRIGWDEALDIVTGEMNRVKETYGATAILYQNDQHGENKTVHGPHGCGRKLLDLFGGYTHQVRNADSWEGWYWGAKHVWGCEYIGQQLPQKNLLYDISKNAELLLFWGCDPETTPWGWGGQLVSRFNYWWSELGIRQIYIAPDCNYGNAVHADKWIPVLPNTDAALYLAIAHRWFTQGTYDKEYLETHAYGVDKFEAYVMGDEDGVPKSPEWAAPITGVPARTIKALADEWASKRTTIVISNGGPAIRGPYSTEPARLQVLCLAMQGLGRPGCNQAKMIEWALGRDPENQAAPKPRVCINLDAAYRGDTPMEEKRDSCIPKTLVPKLILEGEGTWYGNRYGMRSDREDQFIQYKYPADGASKIHMIWTDSPSWITCWNDGNNFIRALRHPDIEFVFCQHPWIENDALFADVILPVNTKLEEDDIGSDIFSGQMDMLYPEPRCMESLGESVSDYEVVCKIAEQPGAAGGVHRWPEHPRDHQVGLGVLRSRPTRSAGRISTKRATTWSRPSPVGRTSRPASSSSTRTRKGTRSTRPPASSSSTPPAWPSTSPTTPSGHRCPSGSPRVSRTRRPSGPSGARSIRYW